MVSELLRDVRARVANMFARGVVRRVDDSKKMQIVQVDLLAEETRDGVERVQQYGFTSVPLAGAEAFAVFLGGVREGGAVLAVDDRRYRLTGLQAGEVALYTDQGDKVVLKRGGTIEVTAATKVVVSAPLVELAGNTDAAARASLVLSELTALRNTVNALVLAYNGHTHPVATTGSASAQTGTAFATGATAAVPTSVSSVASTKVKLS